MVQKTMDIDLLVIEDSLGKFVEEKFIDHAPYKNIAIETIQNTKFGNNNPGWIHVSKADILAWHHCLEDRTQSFFMDLPKLREFYLKNKHKYRHIITRTGVCAKTHPRNCLIPWEDIYDYVGYEYVEIPYKENG